jgi:3-oxoacyl-[acyl-carrier-protein] synthase II
MKLPDSQRIVVTGMEAMTPLGHDLESSWTALIRGEHGMKPLSDTVLSEATLYHQLDAQVVATANYNPLEDSLVEEHRQSLDFPSMHRSHLFAWRTMYRALERAQAIDPENRLLSRKLDEFRVGALVGSVFSGADHLAKVNFDRVRTRDPFQYLFARIGTAAAMHIGIKNLVGVMDTECASGGVTAHIAPLVLLKNRDDMPAHADIMIAGGADAPISEANLTTFLGGLKAAGTRTTDPEAASRPLDQSADGLVMGEAAGMLVLETWENAQKRGLTEDDVLAEMPGYASFTDAEKRTLAGMEGATRVIAKVLEMAGVTVEETVYANGHLTSTGEDHREVIAYRQALQRQRLDVGKFWLTSTKGATGHTMGAAGAIEAIFAIMAMRSGKVPPGLKLHNPIPETEGFNLSPLEATQLPEIDVALSTSLGFGGTATALAFRKFKP